MAREVDDRQQVSDGAAAGLCGEETEYEKGIGCMAEDSGKRPVTQKSFGEIEGYRIKKLIGKGGMGAVYLATQLSMDRDVALKVLLPALAKDRGFVTRFVREARAAGKLQHANIVGGIDVGESGGYYYFVMEYVEGTPVSAILKKRGKIPEANALGIALHIARALEHAWNHQLIHRDIKPSNIIIARDGMSKLMDLGLARSTREDMAVTMTGVAIGTPHYISPEQARGERDLDIRTDIYSLGATLYHMATGVVPFDGDTSAVVMTKHITEKLPSPRSKNPDLSPGICRLIEKMMAKERADRYATPADLMKDIAKVARGGVPVGVKPRDRVEKSERAERAREKPARRVFSSELFWGTVVVGVIVTGIAAFSLLNRGKKQETDAPPSKPVEQPVQGVDEAKLKEMFEYARKWEKDNPEDYEGAGKKYMLVAERGAGTVWEMKALDAMEAIKKRAQEAMASTFDDMEKKALALAARGDYDGALEVFATVPGGLEQALGPAARQAAVRLKQEAEAKLNAAGQRAAQLSREGQPAKALKELDRIAHIKYAPHASKVAILRERLEAEMKDAAKLAEKRAAAAAKNKLEAVWNEFDARLLSGNYVGAKAVLQKAKTDESLAPVRGQIEELSGLLGEFDALAAAEARAVESLQSLVGRDVVLDTAKGDRKGRVTKVADGMIHLRREYRINNQTGWSEEKVAVADLTGQEKARLMPVADPATARGWLAKAIREIGLENLEGAEAAYRKGKDHPLAPRYGEKLDALRFGEAEAAAKGYWQRSLAPLVTVEKLSENQAEEADGHLKKFVGSHGKTKFAESVGDQIAVLQRKIAEATGGEAFAALKKLFRGQILRADPKTLQVELLYDFSNADQLEDWQFKGIREGERCFIANGKLVSHGDGVALIHRAGLLLEDVTFEVSQNAVKMVQFGVHQFAVGSVRGQGSVLASAFAPHSMLQGKRAGASLENGLNKLGLSVSGSRGELLVNGAKVSGVVGKPRNDFLVFRLWGENVVDNMRVVAKLDREQLGRAMALGYFPELRVEQGKGPEGKLEENEDRRRERKMSPEERAERIRQFKKNWERRHKDGGER